MPLFLMVSLPLRCSTLLCLLHLLSPLISLCLQTGGLTSTSDVHNLLTINPLIMLCQNACVIPSKSSNSHLILDSIFDLPLLTLLTNTELGSRPSFTLPRH